MMKPNSAAINMKDSRKVYRYLINNTQAPFQTKPMPIQMPSAENTQTPLGLQARQTDHSKDSGAANPQILDVSTNQANLVQFMIRQKRFVDGKIVITEQGTHRGGSSKASGRVQQKIMKLTEEETVPAESQSPTPNQIILSTDEVQTNRVETQDQQTRNHYMEKVTSQDGVGMPEFMQSVKSNQYLQMMLQAAANGHEISSELSAYQSNAMRAQNKDKEYMNYPYPRATDTLGASMATPSHLLKDRSPTKAKHIKSGTLNINPTEILSQMYGISEYMGKKNTSFDNNGWRHSSAISSEEYPMLSPHEIHSNKNP